MDETILEVCLHASYLPSIYAFSEILQDILCPLLNCYSGIMPSCVKIMKVLFKILTYSKQNTLMKTNNETGAVQAQCT